MTVIATSAHTYWAIGLGIAFGGAVAGVDKVKTQTDALGGIGRINDSGIRILHSARALRKVAVGK